MLFSKDITKPGMLRETPDEKARRARKTLVRLQKTYPNAKIALRYKNPMQLLAAVIMSAQCTDKKVNEVTAVLFKKYKTVDDFANANLDTFSKEIKQTGFYRAKALAVITSAKIIRERFGGKVPRTMKEILELRGVARKTANVVLGNAYGVVEGIAVDTHVRRLTKLLGLTNHTDPKKIEKDLMAILPKDEWFDLTYRMIDYGRKYCPARPHDHENCPLSKIK
jgi:endonuclease-3